MNPISSSTAVPIAITQQEPRNVSAGKGDSAPVVPAFKAPEITPKKEVVIALDTTGTSAASVREFAQPIEKVVQAAAAAIQDFIQSKGSNLSVSVDHTTGYHVIQVTDASGNLVMHLPSEAAVRVAHNMESLQGLFVNNVA
jgi:uncharacterized FlaG/YvyC family protein